MISYFDLGDVVQEVAVDGVKEEESRVLSTLLLSFPSPRGLALIQNDVSAHTAAENGYQIAILNRG